MIVDKLKLENSTQLDVAKHSMFLISNPDMLAAYHFQILDI